MRSRMALHRIGSRATIAAIVLLLLVIVGVHASSAAEIVPSFGLTKSVNGGSDAKTFAGVSVRGHLFPLVQSEIGVSYRSETRFDDRLKVRQWPVTASLYLTPIPTLYAGAGVGWYHTSFDYPSGLGLQDETKQEFGVHVGGGLQVPLAPSAAVDLNGRYVMMRDQQSRLVPEKFDPDFWTTSLGLAIKF